jgi:hypothetical protein
MSSRTEKNARKRKQTAENPEVVVSSDDDQNKSKARRVSTDAVASTATAATLQVDTPVASEEVTAANAASIEHAETYKSIGKMIQDLAHSDNAKVNAALDALFLDLDNDKKKCEKIQAVGGCFVLVEVLKKFLDKAIARIPACNQVTELNEVAELKTLHKACTVIIRLTFLHDESRVGISAIGGVEAVVKVMKTFPKCQALQECACGALRNLACCSVGIANAIESGGIQDILAAINNHLVSADVCRRACCTLNNIVSGSKENTELLISLGGATAVVQVRRKWTDNNDVQTQVRKLNGLIVAEMKTWS